MATKVPIPKLGQSEETVIIDSWRVKEGDKINKGDILFEVETDKAVLEVESQFEGTLLKIFIPAGKEVPVMSIAAVIGEKGEAIPEIEAIPAPAPKAEAAPKAATPAAGAQNQPTPGAASAQKKETGTEPAKSTPSVAAPPAVHKPNPSPRARKFAENYLVDLDRITGSGGDVGRVTEKDVKGFVESSAYAGKKITPTAFNLAKGEKLHLPDVDGTGEGGRVTLADVRDAIAEKPLAMNTMRKIIAQRLSQSKQTIPHFYVTVSVDMSDVMAYRKELKDAGIGLSVNVFVLKAVAKTLKEFPFVNASTDGSSIRRKSKVNVGVAVSVENGLVVPVVKNADRKAMDELHAEVAEMAAKARDGKLSPADMQGGSFTISNMGMLGVENFGAIINPGESAILAVASTIPTAVVKGNAIVIRDVMKMTLSADHRVVDGAMAAEFINAIKNKLEDVDFWRKEI